MMISGYQCDVTELETGRRCVIGRGWCEPASHTIRYDALMIIEFQATQFGNCSTRD